MEWFSEWWDLFWNTYSSDLCSGKRKGSKFKAEESAKKNIKTKEIADKALLALQAQIRNYRILEKKGEHQPPFQHVVTYLNQRMWEEEIDSLTSPNKPAYHTNTCLECSEPVHGPNYDRCSEHQGRYSFRNDPMREKMLELHKESGLAKRPDEPKDEFVKRCKIQAFEYMKRFNKRIVNTR